MILDQLRKGASSSQEYGVSTYKAKRISKKLVLTLARKQGPNVSSESAMYAWFMPVRSQAQPLSSL